MIRQVIVGALSDVPPGEGRTFAIGPRRVAVFVTRQGRVFATQGDCPHRGGPLADGLVGGTTLVCPLHEWTFDLTSGMPLNGSCGIQTYPVHVDASGRLVLELDEAGSAPPWRTSDYVRFGTSE